MVIRVSRSGTARGAAVATAALALACLFACSKSKETPGEPGGAQERRDKAAELTAPAALFAHIPANTPYVLASFQPVPRSYWQRFAPLMRQVAESAPPLQGATEPRDRFIAALVRELKASMSEAGLRKTFGIGAEGHYAIYGIGVVPVVRVELADGKALLATVERLQQESGLTLPTASMEGRSYWRFGDDQGLIVVAVADNQLVFSAGPTSMVEGALSFILGTKQPSPNMADGGLLKQVAARHGFAGYGVGYVDSGNLLKLLFVENLIGSVGGSASIPPACMEQVAALARRFPRLAFGYDEFSDKRIAARIVLETDDALAARFKQLQISVPGLVVGPLAERSLFAVGAGIDIEKGRQLAIDAADGVGQLAGACGSQDVVREAAEARASLSKPLPPGLDKIRGAFVSLIDAALGPDGKPTGVEAYGVLATDDPAGLVTMARGVVPPGQMPELPADGQFHDLVPAGAVPGLDAVRAAIKPRALVAVVGARGAQAVEGALARTGPSPLFFTSYDYGMLAKKVLPAMSGGAGTDQEKFISMFAELFGVMSMWLVPTDHGLALAVSVGLN
jgi:hypothetical protein